jgi:hypothetical protein
MNKQRTLRCVFYSHIWAIHRLGRAGLGDFNNDVLAELAVDSHLAPVFRKQFETRWGLAGVLTSSDCLHLISEKYPYVPAPLILAPNPSVSVSALESAVSVLPSTPGPFTQATLLVHVDDAAKFRGAYAHVERFSVLWDLADLPSLALEQLAAVLAENNCLTPARWAGLHVCRHPLRPVPDWEERRSDWLKILGEFPAVNAEFA